MRHRRFPCSDARRRPNRTKLHSNASAAQRLRANSAFPSSYTSRSTSLSQVAHTSGTHKCTIRDYFLRPLPSRAERSGVPPWQDRRTGFLHPGRSNICEIPARCYPPRPLKELRRQRNPLPNAHPPKQSYALCLQRGSPRSGADKGEQAASKDAHYVS